MFLVQLAQRQQRLNPFRAGLADADEDARGEGHLELACQPHRLQAGGGVLVGRSVVNLPLLHQPWREAFQHDSLRDRDIPQQGDVLARHHAGVGVGQQPRLFRDDARDFRQIRDRRLVSELGQFLARHLVAQLGLVPEREEGLRAARRRPRPRKLQHLVDAHVGAFAALGRLRERAVVADVAAELRQRNEDVARVGDDVVVGLIAECARCRRQGGKVGFAGKGESLFGGGAHTRQGSRQYCLGRLSHPHSGARSSTRAGTR